MQHMQKDDEEKVKLEFKDFVFEETCYKTLFTAKFENRKPWVKPDERKILSYLPGTIKKISVKAGDKINKGDLLLVFEAMKMLNTVKSSQKGVIKQIYVKPGDKFPKNQLLIEFE
jgi:biotin carboxyl carrier protein